MVESLLIWEQSVCRLQLQLCTTRTRRCGPNTGDAGSDGQGTTAWTGLTQGSTAHGTRSTRTRNHGPCLDGLLQKSVSGDSIHQRGETYLPTKPIPAWAIMDQCHYLVGTWTPPRPGSPATWGASFARERLCVAWRCLEWFEMLANDQCDVHHPDVADDVLCAAVAAELRHLGTLTW